MLISTYVCIVMGFYAYMKSKPVLSLELCCLQIDIPVMKGRKSFFKLFHLRPSITGTFIYQYKANKKNIKKFICQ